jgi:hypothetical protein
VRVGERGRLPSYVMARGTPTLPAGWLGVDPVDTAAVPAAWLRMPTFSADEANTYSPESLVFGTGLGSEAPACAPTGFNHVQFYEHCTSAPAWHVVAPSAGHVSMLDDDVGLVSKAFCRLCKPSRVPGVAVRTWLSGAMAAFMKPGCMDEFLARPSPELSIVVTNRTADAAIMANLVAAS